MSVSPRRIATGLWMLAILTASLVPGAPGPGGWGWHILGYGILAVLMRTWMRATAVAGTAWGYGLVVEGLQGLTSFRTAEVADLGANALGVAAGLLLAAALRRWGKAPEGRHR